MDERNFRAIARERLDGDWGVSIGVAAVAALLGGLLVGGSFLPDLEAAVSLNIPFLTELVEKLNESLSFGRYSLKLNFGTGSFLGFAAMILGGVLQLGYAKFLLAQHDGQPHEFSDLFSQFDRFGAGFVQGFLRNLYVFLWSLLFIIPGIIAGYSYAMTPFLMADFPQLTASEAISKSKELMDGHKGDLFVLDLSFFGWALLCLLTANIGNLWLNPYRNAAYAAFYRQLLADQRYTSVE